MTACAPSVAGRTAAGSVISPTRTSTSRGNRSGAGLAANTRTVKPAEAKPSTIPGPTMPVAPVTRTTRPAGAGSRTDRLRQARDELRVGADHAGARIRLRDTT